jgi:hypothetical protein
VEELRKKERQDETQFTTKIDGFLSFIPFWILMYFFASFFRISPCVWPNSWFWCCVLNHPQEKNMFLLVERENLILMYKNKICTSYAFKPDLAKSSYGWSPFKKKSSYGWLPLNIHGKKFMKNTA